MTKMKQIKNNGQKTLIYPYIYDKNLKYLFIPLKTFYIVFSLSYFIYSEITITILKVVFIKRSHVH
jgi:hypothetical protein